MDSQTITVWFPGSHAVPHLDTTLKAVAADLLSSNFSPGKEPLKLTILEEERTLYYDEHVLRMFVKDQITINTLFEKLTCEGLYRNKVKMFTASNSEIEAGSLWMLLNNMLTLVNEDEYHTYSFSGHKDLFVEVV